jgi:hypothetical protein
MAQAEPFGEIRCQHCHEWFRSPIGFGTPKAFFTSTLIGNTAQCPHCGKPTGCDKEHMRWRTADEGFVGNESS